MMELAHGKDYTPGEIAIHCGVSTELVYAWINDTDEETRLRAVNRAGAGGGKPRWFITRAILEDFDQRRSRPRGNAPNTISVSTG